jgi:hypothetical protein
VIGGADIPFSNNGPLDDITHTAGTTTLTVSTAGTYQIDYQVSITAGIGSQLAVAVNGVVNSSTPVTTLVATGLNAGTAMLNLSAGDVVTLRNNSLVAMTMALAPAVSAQMNLVRIR